MILKLGKRPFFTFLICAWIVLPCLLPPLGERGGTVTVSDILGGLTILYCGLLATRIRMRLDVSDVALVVYLTIVVSSCLFYFGDRDTALLFARSIRLVLIFSPAFIFIFVRLELDSIRSMLRLYIVAATVGILLPLIAYAMGLQSAMANQTIDLDATGVINRAGGWVGDSSAFGHEISCLALILVLGLLSGVFEFRLLYLGSFAVVLYGLYATSSRTALVTIFCATGLFLLLGPAKITSKLRSISLLVLICGFATLGIFLAYSLGYLKGLGNVVDKLLTPFELIFNASRAAEVSSGRLENWGALFDRVGWRVLYGTGFGTLPLRYGIEDNVVIKSLGETGLAGLLALVTVVGGAVYRFWRRRRIALAAMMLFFTLGQCVNAMFVDTTSFFSSMPVVVLFGFACYKHLRNDGRERDSQLTESTAMVGH
jgi:hypothetical protein